MNRIDDGLLTEWHNATKNSIDAATVPKRKKAFENILERNDVGFWQDLLKIYLGSKVSGANISFFALAFQNEDRTFPVVSADKLLKSLAGMALALKMDIATKTLNGVEFEDAEEEEEEEQEEEGTEEEEETDEEDKLPEGVDDDILNFIIASALVNSNFLKQYKTESKIPAIDYAGKYLVASSKESRQDSLTEHESEIYEIQNGFDEEEGGELDAKEAPKVVAAIGALINANKILSEESNILWWLFGEYSGTVDKFFHEIGAEASTIIAAKELSELSKFQHEIAAAKGILARLLSQSIKGAALKATSLKKCVLAIDEPTKQKIISSIDASINEMTPCLLALKKSGKGDWEKPFGAKLNEDLDARTIAMQFYREFLFIKTLS